MHQRLDLPRRKSRSIFFIVALDNGFRSDAAMFSATCAGRFAPGIAQVTAGNSRIQRNASCASVAPSGTNGFQFLHRAQAGLEIHARKRLAAVKRLAVPVEIPMIVLRELAVARDFARQHARRQRHARQDPDLAPSALPGKTIPPGADGKC